MNLRKDHYRVSKQQCDVAHFGRRPCVLVERKNVYGQRAVSVGLNSRSRFRVVTLLGCCGASGYLSRSDDDDDDDDDCLLSSVVVVVVGMRGAAVGLSRAERWRRFEERVATLARRPACRIFSLSYIYGRCIRTALDSVTKLARRLHLDHNCDTTLSGGSLGSCVDEERSQLREVM